MLCLQKTFHSKNTQRRTKRDREGYTERERDRQPADKYRERKGEIGQFL